MRKTLSLLLLSLCFASLSSARTLTVGNGDFRSEISFSGHRFTGVSFVDGRSGRVLTTRTQLPVFELCVDGRLYTSADPVWNYRGQSVRELGNGGRVVSYTFRGRGELRGLILVWDREYFPRDAFVRERLRLRSSGNAVHCLNKRDGACHLVFPRYSFLPEGPVQARELRLGDFRKKRAFPDHHMFHPDSSAFALGDRQQEVKGPFLLLKGPQIQLLSSYEHASQDHSFAKDTAPNEGNDGAQGLEGDIRSLTDDDLWFIGTFASLDGNRLSLGNRIRHGGYLDGEEIPSDGWYETVWSTLSLLPPGADPDAAIADYLLNKISDNAESRVADFYYNSWGMQRASKDLYSVMTQERLREEIRYAAECGVQTFVIDDGWHETFGHWVGNPVRIPSGLKALAGYMDSLGIRPGIWLSLPGAGAQTERALAHPEWIIRDARGEPVRGQWKNPVYDIVGPYYDCLLSDLKALCDEGFRFFKWDAMNTLSSSLPGLYHGDERYSSRERADRYNYLLPFYVTRLMRELREYCPGVVVELDLTEPERCMIGLQTLQEGKYYFINNGSSRYNDYSSYRTRSVRAVINEYARWIPQELFTYAVYPHDQEGMLDYNITTALTAGHGIWGDLSLMTPEERGRVKALFDKASLVLPQLKGHRVEVTGRIDDSPEIYVQRDPVSAYALVTAFSREALSRELSVEVRPEAVLGVLGHPFSLTGRGVNLPLHFAGEDDCAAAFVLGGRQDGPQVSRSTGRLDSVVREGSSLKVRAATDSEVCISWPDGRTETRFIPAGETAAWQL